MKSDLKLLLVNVALAFMAAFAGALAVAENLEKAAVAAAAYGAFRAAIGLGAVYAQRISQEAQAELDKKLDNKGF